MAITVRSVRARTSWIAIEPVEQHFIGGNRGQRQRSGLGITQRCGLPANARSMRSAAEGGIQPLSARAQHGPILLALKGWGEANIGLYGKPRGIDPREKPPGGNAPGTETKAA